MHRDQLALRHYLTRMLADTSGAVAIMWGLVLPLMVGGIALGTDVGSWYFAKRNLQNSTDTAAIAAGYDLGGSNPQQSTMWNTAHTEMVRNGFGNDVTLTVNYPPVS